MPGATMLVTSEMNNKTIIYIHACIYFESLIYLDHPLLHAIGHSSRGVAEEGSLMLTRVILNPVD